MRHNSQNGVTVLFSIEYIFAVAAVLGTDDGGVCRAGEACDKQSYFWPMARGPVGSHGTSPHKSPRNLTSSLAWSWHAPEGKYTSVSNGGVLIDDKKNLYVSFSRGIHKFSPDGQLLWHTIVPHNDIPAIMDDVLYGTSTEAYIFAMSMETGAFLWKSIVCSWKGTPQSVTGCNETCSCERLGADIGAVGAHKGVVIAKTHEPVDGGGGSCRIAALNASDGSFMWDYVTDHLIWNFYPIYTDDGESLIFQDSTAGVYRLRLDGNLMWKVSNSEGWYETWTDGGLMLGPNGIAYAMKASGHNQGPGFVRAYRIADGKFLWESLPMDEVPNSWPVIGRLREDHPLTVMAPYGNAGGDFPLGRLVQFLLGDKPDGPLYYALMPIFYLIARLSFDLGDWGWYLHRARPEKPEIWGMHAETGEVLWKFAFPVWWRGPFRGDDWRMLTGRPICVPNPCGNPTLDAAGTFHIGMLDGIIYSLIASEDKVGVKVASTFDSEAAFSNGGTSIAPGMMAIANCDTLFVFKE